MEQSGEGKNRLTRDELRDLLQVSLRAGQIMLENGANTARAEEAIHQLGTALGADWMEVYVTPTGIIASAVSQEESRTRMLRIVKSAVQLSKVQRVLALVQRLKGRPIGYPDVRDELDSIDRMQPSYSTWLTALAVGLACAAFCLLFGGGIRESGVVVLVSGLAQLLRHRLLHTTRLGRFLTTTVVAAFASYAAAALSAWVGCSQVTVAASLLLLVPGVPLVSSTADLFRGDTLAGIARAVNAFLTVLTGGAGVWAVVLLSGYPIELQLSRLTHPVEAGLMGFLAASGFAILFDVPPRHLFWAGLAGAVSATIRCWAQGWGVPLVGASFVAGLALGVVAHQLAHWRLSLSSLFAIPGYIPLVPGAVAFRAMLHLVKEEYELGLADLIQVGLVLVAVAVGMGAVRTLLHSHHRPA